MRVMSDEEYTNYLDGKRVIMVAHADSLVGSGRGNFIDSYDVVVRFNDSIPIPEELKPDIGTRCDILYSSIAPQFRVTKHKLVQPFIDLGVKAIVRPTPLKMDRIEEISLSSHNVTYWYERLEKALEGINIGVRVVGTEPYRTHTRDMNGKLPLTGVAALWDLLEFSVSEVYMTGFNFFIGGTYEQYAANPISENQKAAWKEGTGLHSGRWHVVLPQVRYLSKLIRRDKRIKIDKHLAEILSRV